jgi:hypothetical protein
MIDEPLSPEGAKRRDAILLLAKAEARRRRSRRLASRGFVGLAVVGLIAVAVWRLPIAKPPVEIKPPIARLTISPPPPSVAIEYVQTDPTITDRLTLRPSPPRWTNIGDDELVQELAAAGQPAGIVSMNGKSILLPRAETR